MVTIKFNFSVHISRRPLFRFGFGGRRCPGMYYANLVLANSMVRLFSKYKLIPLDMTNIDKHQDVPLLASNMTMLPDIKVRIATKGELILELFSRI